MDQLQLWLHMDWLMFMTLGNLTWIILEEFGGGGGMNETNKEKPKDVNM